MAAGAVTLALTSPALADETEKPDIGISVDAAGAEGGASIDILEGGVVQTREAEDGYRSASPAGPMVAPGPVVNGPSTQRTIVLIAGTVVGLAVGVGLIQGRSVLDNLAIHRRAS